MAIYEKHCIPQRRYKAADYERMLEFYNDGLNDREIKDAMGCSFYTVIKFRSMYGLPAQRDARRESRCRNGLDRDAIEAHKRHMTYGFYMTIKPKEAGA